ncbi:hypothetical protein [Kitasatospora sp. NPDC002040]|uniref:hypothetical protein n=1 Tax=Kitasatospora sp. NPDC002040 TaxID=3154661 RepID=UPI00331C70BE
MTSQRPNHSDQSFLSVYAALVLLAAAFIGLVGGGLTFFSGSSVATAVLAGATAFGVSVPVLRSLIS